MGINPVVFAHYLGLQQSTRYLRMHELQDGALYVVHGRNSHIGCWCARDESFILMREKYGYSRVGKEFHWDANKNGTAKPFVKLECAISSPTEEMLAEILREMPYERCMALTAMFVVAQ